MWLTALKVSDYVAPTRPDAEVPKHMHLDVAVTDLDPAGHPFCLTTRIPPEVR